MAPNINDSESPSKKRKQPINGMKRNQPLFAQRRPNHSLQQPPDFLTDSLNTSYIPSPSPPKSPTRQHVRVRSRQTLLNSTSLAAAFKHNVNDENKPLSSSSDHNTSSQSLKPRPTQSIPRAKSKSPSKPARSPVRARTPSPLRGRATSITSPTASESSPPRGYAEAYQRIVEEENLAQEESVEDMEDITGYDFNEQDRSQDLDRMRLQRIQQSPSPVSLRVSRRASPGDNKENVGHESDGESSASYMENITDTSMDSGSSRYAKDLQRLKGALKSGKKAFSKARVGDRVGITIDNLQRKGSDDSLGSAFSAGSLSNRGSDPSVNVPKAWGRKAKPGRDWLSRINSRSGKLTGDVPKRHSSGDQIIAENQKREWAEPIDEWITTAAEVPLPSVEGSSQTALSSQGSTPTTAVQRSTSLDRRRQWEVNDDDFTGRSFQVSDSPPIRIRSGALDRIREREIESIEKRAVTTSRLGELRKVSTITSPRRRIGFEEAEGDDSDGLSEASPQRQTSGKSTAQSEQLDLDQDSIPETTPDGTGEAIPDTPIVIYRANSNGIVFSSDKSATQPESKVLESRRPSHERKDSHDLLRRLAKATSESPSPAKQFNEPGQSSSEESHDQVQQTPQNPRPTSNLKTPVITGAWVDQTMEDTPQISRADENPKTPLVTGAWIDTPLPTGGRGPPMPTPSDAQEDKELGNGKLGAAELIHKLSPNNISARPKLQNQAPLKYSGPPLAKSALQEIINEARDPTIEKRPKKTSSDSDFEEDPTLHLGDSTIQSLEELIANDEDFSTLLAPTPPSPETAPSSSEQSPSSQAVTTTSRSSRLSDLQSYTQLLSRLTNLAPSLRASKKQIASLERTISASPSTHQTQTIAERDEGECTEAGEFHDFIWPCQRCGCPGRMEPDLQPLVNLRDHITSVTIPIPRLWRWRRDDWRPRLTWLGVFTLLAWALYWGEMWARARFCHPIYARSMVGYGVDINAPRPPFVLAKVMYKYTAVGTVMAPFYHFARITVKVVASLIGYLAGFAAGGGGGVEQRPASRDERIPRPDWGPDLRFMDDEYL